MTAANYNALPTDLLAPKDDHAVDHLKGMTLPSVALRSTDGQEVDISKLHGLIIVYAYPKTGVPGQDMPNGWDAIPGARGCTPEACSFRDHFSDLKKAGAHHVFGLSTQSQDYQKELCERLHLPFTMLSDQDFKLTHAMTLPSFQIEGETLLKRFTLVIQEGVIVHVFYPIFPPNEHAEQVLEWLKSNKTML